MADRVPVSVSVNGTTLRPRGRTARPARLLSARGSRADRDARRLRHQPVRRVHRPASTIDRSSRARCSRCRPTASSLQTVEGLAINGQLHPLQQAFWNEHGLQCGFCTPGFLMTATALLARQPAPERSGDPQGPRGQPVPLHGLREHRESRPVGQRGDGRWRGRWRPAPLAREGLSAWRSQQMIGARIHRREDPRLITGGGRYVEDLVRPGHAVDGRRAQPARARAHHAHRYGRRPQRDARRGRRADRGRLQAAPDRAPTRSRRRSSPRSTPSPIASRSPRAKSCFQGEPVAVVVAENRKLAVDARRRPSRSTTSRCPRSRTCSRRSSRAVPRSHATAPDNIGLGPDVSRPKTTVKDAFAQAEVVVKERILQQRLAPIADRAARRHRRVQPLRRPAHDLAGDAEPALHPTVRLGRAGHARDEGARHLARRRRRLRQQDLAPIPRTTWSPPRRSLLRRPVRWIETRTESLQTTTHGRGQIFDVELAAKRDGTLAGAEGHPVPGRGRLRRHVRRVPGVRLPAGGRRLQAGRAASPRAPIGVLTNRVPTDPYRGAGRPEATHRSSAWSTSWPSELGMDPAEIRAQELHPARGVPVHQPLRARLRLGQLRGRHGQGARARRLRRAAPEAEGGAPAGQVPGHRPVDVDRDLRLRARARATAGATGGLALVESAQVRMHPTGSVAGLRRHARAWPGPRDDLRADRRRHARRAVRLDRDPPRRHRRGPGVRLRHVRQPQSGRRRHGRARRPQARSSTRRTRSPRTCSRRRPTTSSSTRAAST